MEEWVRENENTFKTTGKKRKKKKKKKFTCFQWLNLLQFSISNPFMYSARWHTVFISFYM